MSADSPEVDGPNTDDVQKAIDDPGYHTNSPSKAEQDAEPEKKAEPDPDAPPSIFDAPEDDAARKEQEKEAQKGDSPKADDAKSGDTEKEKTGAEGDAEGAPEQYESFELPEGMDSVNEERMGQFQEVARESGLNQGQAQKLITLAAEHTGEIVNQTASQILKAQTEAHQKLYQGYEAERRAHPVFGGVNYDASNEDANLAVTEFEKELGMPMRDSLRETQAGKIPAVWGILAAAGKQLRSGSNPRLFRAGGRAPRDAGSDERPTRYAEDGIGDAE